MKKQHSETLIPKGINASDVSCLLQDRHHRQRNQHIAQSLVLSCLLSCCTAAAGQTISYTYDDAGNRISKSVVTAMSRAGSGNGSVSLDGDDSDIASDVLISYSDEMITFFVSDIEDVKSYDIVISNISGQVVKRETVTKEVHVVNTRDYLSGVYIVCLTYNGKKQSWKFTKE